MSDKMQSTSRPKDHQKTSKFVEGRLKLSTSCTECHRRKQKCDQKQPCRHCARRYPLPQCIYKSINDVSSAGSNQASSSTSEPQLVRPPLLRAQSNKSLSSSRTSPDQDGEENQSPEVKQVAIKLAKSSLSPDSFDYWGPSEYQDLLTTMVDNIANTVQSEKTDSSPGPNSHLHSDFESPQSAGHRELVMYQKSRRKSVQSPSASSISVDPLHFLGIVPTHDSSELLQAFVKVITKYVVSIDGSPKPNYYNDIWVPWCMKSPLLAYLGIFTASCYQSEAQKIPPQQSAVVLGYKLKVISILNEMLRSDESSTSAEAIAAVTYLITNEWYWSNFENVQAHMRGLKEMVRLRGGLGDLGMSGFLRKMIILNDYHISCSYNIELSFPHNIITHVRYPATMSTPLLYSLVSFTTIATELQLASETASILDDMRFLLMAVLKHLSSSLSLEEERIKLTTTATWIQTRISSLPDGGFSSPHSHLTNDFIYKSCRIAALIYCRAICKRKPLSNPSVCSLKDLNMLWSCMWRVTLTQWKGIPGIFTWIILSGNQAAQDTPHGRFLKSMYKAATSYIALDHFECVDASLWNYSRVQKWLRTEAGDDGGMERGPAPERAMSFLHNYKR